MHAVIETPRTILRELILEDVDSLLQIFADQVAMQHYPSTKNREQTEKWIRWNLQSYEGAVSLMRDVMLPDASIVPCWRREFAQESLCRTPRPAGRPAPRFR